MNNKSGLNFDPNKVQTVLLFSRRYRNRRLGDFLKDLNLTEGKAAGIPIIKGALIAQNSVMQIIKNESKAQPLESPYSDSRSSCMLATNINIHIMLVFAKPKI